MPFIPIIYITINLFAIKVTVIMFPWNIVTGGFVCFESIPICIIVLVLVVFIIYFRVFMTMIMATVIVTIFVIMIIYVTRRKEGNQKAENDNFFHLFKHYYNLSYIILHLIKVCQEKSVIFYNHLLSGMILFIIFVLIHHLLVIHFFVYYFGFIFCDIYWAWLIHITRMGSMHMKRASGNEN